MNATEILDFLNEEISTFNTDIYKIGKALRSSGCETASKRFGKSVKNCYHLHKIAHNQSFELSVEGEEINTTDDEFGVMFLKRKVFESKTCSEFNV